MKISKKKLVWSIGVITVLIQFVPVNKKNEPVNTDNDFLYALNAPENIVINIRKACYDCHSDETTYPWYTSVAPLSWWIKHHINEGRSELNFSKWQTYSVKRKKHKLEECVEMIQEDEMPMESYLWMHSNAQLSDAEKQAMVEWLKQVTY